MPTIVKLKALYIETNKIKKINMLRLSVVGRKTIITPQNPIIIAIQLKILSFSFKTSFANINKKKGDVISNIVKRLMGIFFNEKKTIKRTGIKVTPLIIGKK